MCYLASVSVLIHWYLFDLSFGIIAGHLCGLKESTHRLRADIMETMKELVALQKPIMLDEGNFGHWKARMRHIIRGIDEDAWTAVEQGWTAPTMVMDDKSMEPLPKERWTDSDKAASKFNSKALTTIFSPVDLNQFMIIQGCESAKEARDTLINHFEGNTSVRRTRIDHLASKFENQHMEDDESIGSFISKNQLHI